MCDENIAAYDHAGDEVADAIDGDRVPGDEFDEQAAEREADGGEQHTDGAKQLFGSVHGMLL